MDQKSFAIVGNVVFDHGVEGGVEKLPQFRPGLDSSTDQVAAVDGEHLERIGAPALSSSCAIVRISSIVST